MASRNTINIVLNLDTAAFNRALSGAVFSIDKFGKKLEQTGQNLTTRLTIPLGLAGAAAVQTFLQFDKLEKGLIVFAGSSEAAAKELDGLKSVVLDTRTTIGFQDAVQGALRLRSIGFEADEAREALRQLGIATTASGKTSEDLGEVVNQLTQIIGRGKVLQQDIRVILDRLPVLSTVFKETFGGVSAEAIRNSTENVGDFANKLFTAIQQGERFGNVQTSAAKQVETFKESLQLALAEVGRSIFENLRLGEVLGLLSDAINKLVKGFTELSPGVQRFVVVIGALAVAIGPLLIALGALSRLFPLIIVGFTTLGGPVVIAAVLGIGAVALAVSKLSDQFGGNLNRVIVEFEALFVGTMTTVAVAIYNTVLKVGNGIKALNALATGNFQAYGEVIGKLSSLDNALNEGLKAYINTKNKRFDEQIEEFARQQKASEEASKFDFSGLADRLTNTGGTTLEEALLSQANYFKTQNQRQPFPNFAPLPAQGDIGDQLRGVSQQFFPLPASVKSTTAEIEKLNQALTSTQNPAEGLKGRITEILQESRLLGLSVEDQYGRIIGEIESTISSVTEQFGAQSAVLPVLIEYLSAYQTGLIGVQAEQERIQATANAVGNSIETIGSAFADAISGALSFSKAVKKAFLEIIGSIVNEIIALQIRNFLNSPAGLALGPIGAAAAVASGKALGSIVKALLSRVSLAGGGIVSGETLVRVGEYPGARVNPEVIAPLDKLKNLIGGGDGYIAEARISGDDLLILVDRAERRLNRIR